MKEELDAKYERWIWIGLLLLCGDSAYEGQISYTKTIGFTDEQLANNLDVPLKIFIETKNKLASKKIDKIKILKNNVIKIVNWSKYQSEYYRQKKFRDEKLRQKVTTKSYDTEGEGDIDIEGEGDIDKNKKKDMSSSFKNNIISKWNKLAQKHNLPAITDIKSASLREKNLRARSAEKEFDFDLLLDIIDNSPFLLGKTKDPFFVFFDWIIKPSNYQKVIEGNYLDRQSYQKFSGIIEGIKELGKKAKEEDKNETGRS